MKQNYEEKLEWQGMPVLTTRMLAERLGIMEINVRKNFMVNKDRFAENKDYFVLQGKDFQKFKAQLRNSGLLSYSPGKQASSIALWTEGGCHNHAKISETGEAWEAFLWLKDNYFKQREALKAIKQALTPKTPLLGHVQREVQVNNSKEVNRVFYEFGGQDSIKAYNTQSCLLHSGYYPKQLKAIAKKKGLKAKQMTSGKEVLRHLKPEVAASMSVTDDLCKFGAKLEEVVELSKATIPLFAKMNELGMKILPDQR